MFGWFAGIPPWPHRLETSIYIYIILAKPAYIEIHFATISVTVFTSINLSIYGGFHISSPRCGAHQLCAASSRKESFKEPPAFLSTSDAMKMGSKWHSPRSDGFDILRIYHNFSIQMATWVCLKMVNTSEWLSDWENNKNPWDAKSISILES